MRLLLEVNGQWRIRILKKVCMMMTDDVFTFFVDENTKIQKEKIRRPFIE